MRARCIPKVDGRFQKKEERNQLNKRPPLLTVFQEFSVINPSCYLPKEVEAASEYKKCDFDFKTFGSDGMNRFW